MFLKKVIRSTTLEVDANIDELIAGLMEVQGRCDLTYKDQTRNRIDVSHPVFFYCLNDGSFVYSGNKKKPKNSLLSQYFPFFIQGKLYADTFDKTKIKIEYVQDNKLFLDSLLVPLFFATLLTPIILISPPFHSLFISFITIYAILALLYLIYFIIDYSITLRYRNINLANMQEDLFKKVKKITEDKNEIKHIL